LKGKGRLCRQLYLGGVCFHRFFRKPPKVLTEAEVIEAEAELKALQRHALEVVDPEAES
jgi:hypothetical protein